MLRPSHIMPSMPVQLYQLRRYDPTRTMTIRNKFAAETKRRFKRLNRIVRRAILQEGILDGRVQTSSNPKRYDDSDVVQQFLQWLERQENNEILATDITGKAWSDKYIEQGYRQGMKRSRSELARAGYQVPTVAADGGLEAIAVQPIHSETANVLGMSIRNDVQNATNAMNNQISRTLAASVIEGRGNKLIADQITKILTGLLPDVPLPEVNERFISGMRRTVTIGRTGVVKAHHVATVQEYKTWGVDGVNVQAEFVTAGDGDVCEECLALEEKSPYPLQEVITMIPVHPNCRCVALPIRKES